MGRLFEILGKAITVDVADLIWHWLDTVSIPDESKLQNIREILELISKRKLSLAEEKVRYFLFDNNRCVYGQMASAAVYLYDHQIERAVEALKMVFSVQPNNTMALYAIGHCYERLGRQEKAAEFYQDCLKFKNYLKLPHQRLGAIYFKDCQLEKTILEYELLQKEYPDDISTIVTLGYLYIAKSDFIRAIDKFNTAILIHPDNFHGIDENIESLVRNGQLEEAAEMLEDRINEQPDRADLIIKYADVLSMLGASDDAMTNYEYAVKLFPGYLEATIKYGTALLRTQRESEAAEQFNRAVEINDQIVDAYIGLTIAQQLSNNKNGALATLSLASAICANSALLLAETAKLQFKTHLGFDLSTDYNSDSQELMNEVIRAHQHQNQSNPLNPDVNYRIGVLFMSMGKYDEAAIHFERALEINPTYYRAASKLALCLFETGQKEKALERICKSEKIEKDALELHYKISMLYCDKIKFASSILNLQEHLQNNFTQTETTINIAIVLQNLGLLDRASHMWDSIETTANYAKDNFGFENDDFTT